MIFGPRRTFAASLALFTLAYALLLLLALQGILPRPLAALLALYPVHLRWSLKTLAEGLTYASIRRLHGALDSSNVTLAPSGGALEPSNVPLELPMERWILPT